MNKQIINFKCTEDFKQKLEELARKENRTVSGQIRYLVLREWEKIVNE